MTYALALITTRTFKFATILNERILYVFLRRNHPRFPHLSTEIDETTSRKVRTKGVGATEG